MGEPFLDYMVGRGFLGAHPQPRQYLLKLIRDSVDIPSMKLGHDISIQFAATLLAFLFPFSTGAVGQETKKLTKSEALNAAVAKVPPEYPPLAKQLKVEGSVELEAVISESGTVEKVTIVSGNPVLTRPASEARGAVDDRKLASRQSAGG
jgi:hypothetical protein